MSLAPRRGGDAVPAAPAGTGHRTSTTKARRAGWSFVDQVLSSASNFALSAFVAATISAKGFGAFTLVYAVYGVCVGLSAGLASIPLVVRFSAAQPARVRTASRDSVSTALAAGIVAGVACLLVAPLTAPGLASLLVALAVTLPGLLVQDAWRYGFVTSGRPAKAAANDGLWIFLQLAGSAALLGAGAVSALSMVLVWGGSAWAAALLGCWQARLIPSPRQAFAWLREQRELTWRYAAEAVIHRSGSWLALGLVGAVAGLQVIGALRGALLLLAGPLNLILLGATFVFVPEGVRLLHRSPARLPAATRRLSGAATAAALAWCLVVFLLPDAVGSRVLGTTWPEAKSLLLILVPFVVALGASLGAIQGMLALGAARRSLFTQAAGLGVQVPSMTGAAVLAGAKGAAVATALTTVFRTVLAWVQFRRALAEPAASTEETAGEHAASQATAGKTDGRQSRVRVLMVTQLPPPFLGQAVAAETFVTGHHQSLEVFHVRMAFSREIADIGRPRLGKILHLVGLIVRVLWRRARTGAKVLYYPPAGPHLVPALRDVVFLLCTRWAFRSTAFHFHAAGLSEIEPRLPRPLRPLFRAAYGGADLAIQTSALDPPDGRRLGAQRVAVVANGIPDHSLAQQPRTDRRRSRPVLLYVGVLCEPKGLLVLAEACRRLRERSLDFYLHLMGAFESDRFEHALRTSLEDAGLTDRTVFLGTLSGNEKAACFRASDVFCYPSHFEAESFGQAVVEAMQFSLPVVATRWRGIPSVVAHGESGILVPVRDPSRLEAALTALLDDHELRRRMGSRGRELYLEQFTDERYRRDMEAALREL